MTLYCTRFSSQVFFFFTPKAQKLSQFSCFFSIQPAVPSEEDVASLVCVWLLYLSGCICGYGPECSQTPKIQWVLVIFCRSFEEWKWNLARNAFHASVLMLTNGYHCAFIWEHLDGIRFHDGGFVWRASQHFCSFQPFRICFPSSVWFFFHGKIFWNEIFLPPLCVHRRSFSFFVSTRFIFSPVLGYVSLIRVWLLPGSVPPALTQS